MTYFWSKWPVVALLTVGATALIQGVVESFFGPGPTLIYYLPAVTIAAWLGGLKSGLLAIVLATLWCDVRYLSPAGLFQISNFNVLTRLLILWFHGILVSLIMESLHSSRRRSEASRRQVEILRDQLWMTEAKLKDLVDHSATVISVKDLEGRYQLANRAFEGLLGDQGQTVVGSTDFDLFPGQIAEKHRAEDQLVLASGKALEFEDSIPIGERDQTFLTLKFPLRGSNGAPYAVGSFSTNISARKIHEEQLRKSEEEFRLLADSIPQLVWIANETGSIFWFNRQTYEYTGKTFEELQGWGWVSVYPPAEVPSMTARWKATIASGKPYEGGLPIRGADGVFRNFLSRVNPVKNHDGQIIRWFGTSTDISERTKSEMTNARLAAIVESSEDAIVGKDLEGVITSWNAAAERLFGYTAGEVIGKNVTLIIPPDRLGEESEILGRVRRGIPVDHYETVRRRKDGSLVDVSLTVSPVRNAKGEVIGASKIARDITEIKRAESVLLENLKLREQFAKVAESVPGVVHTFRMTPDGRSCMPFATIRIEDLYGFPVSELAKDFSPVYSQVHKDDRKQMVADVDEAFQNQRNWHGKFRYNHPIKGMRWIEGWSSSQLESDGSVLWHGLLMDVTEVEEAKLAKQESLILARSILESLASHIAVLDENGIVVNVNQAWRRFAEENGGETQLAEGVDYFLACLNAYGDSQEIALTVVAGIKEVIAGQRPSFEVEYPCHSPRERRWFVCRVTPFLEEGPKHVVVAHTNITALKETEERLLSRERMLAQSQIMAHVGSWELELSDLSNLNANTLRWSDECMRIFGYEPNTVEITRELFFKAVDPDHRTRIESDIARLIADGTTYRFEHRIRRPDGTERYVEEWGEILKETENEHPRIIGTTQDITERKEAENALKKSADLLENLWSQLLQAQEDERRRIARELHDELGQSLTALKINLQQIHDGCTDGEARLVDSIEISSQALQQVRGMALDLRPSILDDLGLVAALRWFVSRQAQRTGLIGRFIAEPDNLRLDLELETVCFRIVQGALTNVARHARAKSFSVELLLRPEAVLLNVRDDGVGFDLKSTFQSVISGNSLGLAGMRERVEMIGGTIEFLSQPGDGTEIRMHFPHGKKAE